MAQEQKRNRSIQKLFWVDEEEEIKIKRRMQEHRLKNFSAFARSMLLEGEVKVINFDELRKFRSEVKRIGVNVNQVARQVNLDDEVSSTQLALLLEQVKELNQKMTELIHDQLKEES